MGIKLKKKKKKRFYIFFLITLYLISFLFTVKYYINKKDESEVLRYIIENNSNYMEKTNDKRVVTKLISFIANIDFSNPLSLINNNYEVSSVSDDIDMEVVPVSNYVKDPYPEKEITKPIVYLYNTHQSEEYAKSNTESYNIKPTVMTASYILREKLNKNNIPTIVEENDITEFLNTNNWNYAASYKVSRMLMEDAKEKNNSLVYFVDLHRDSVSKKISTVSINNKSYAKILFIVGLENSNYQENLALTEKLNNMFESKYPGISRGIYKKQGKGVNGVYNQDFSNKTILIEIGGEDNTIDEVYNTCEAISVILTEYIRSDINE